MSRVQGVVVVGCIIDVVCSLFNVQHHSHSLALRTLLPYCSFLYVSNSLEISRDEDVRGKTIPGGEERLRIIRRRGKEPQFKIYPPCHDLSLSGGLSEELSTSMC